MKKFAILRVLRDIIVSNLITYDMICRPPAILIPVVVMTHEL